METDVNPVRTGALCAKEGGGVKPPSEIVDVPPIEVGGVSNGVKDAKYIYCIIPTDKPETFGQLGIGGRRDVVYTVSFNDIAAVVSDSPLSEYSTSRDNLISHERAIEQVMKQYNVLPVRFNTIAEDENKIMRILEKTYDNFKDLLEQNENRKELGLRALFDMDIVYEEVMEKNEEIKALKIKAEKLPPGKNYYQCVEIGRLVEAALEQEKEEHEKNIMDTLSPLAVDVRANKSYGDRMIVNAAFYIERQIEEEFDRKIYDLDEEYGYKIKFKYITTVPPFNFINIVINTKEYQDVSD
ncbi:MAG: GvpL/GvpF family gas vesicle protein [Elusimicrobiota bacterium]